MKLLSPKKLYLPAPFELIALCKKYYEKDPSFDFEPQGKRIV
jgi:hypothetical protein